MSAHSRFVLPMFGVSLLLAATSKILDTSRGKLDATGTDEAGWARDRRVDIDLQ